MSTHHLFYIDESGTTNMNPENLDQYYPVFVLGGVLFAEKSYQEFDLKFRKLKLKYFETEDYVLHNAEIKRPAKFGTSWLTQKFSQVSFRKRFYFDLENLIKESDFKLIACGIRKWAYIEAWRKLGANLSVEVGNLKDGGGAVFSDPYLICLERILEKALAYVQIDEKIDIYPEKITRSVRRDPHMNEAMMEMQKLGIESWPKEKVQNNVRDFKLIPKKNNESGHQLIDLLLSPIGRRIMGKMPSHTDNGIRWEIAAEKFEHEADLIVLPEH